ncbi:MAG: hypothetical protein Kow00121_03460 [Elainellaceae cyanobacterium]
MIKSWILSALAIAIMPMACEPSEWPLPLPSSQTSPSPPSEPIAPLTAIEQEIFDQVNQYRVERGFAALALAPSITEQARQHSQEMAASDVLSHDGFEQRVASIGRSIAYRSAAENVAYNQGFADPSGQAVTGWINSPGHLQNIEGTFNLTGVGVFQTPEGKYFFTQIFVLRR